MGSKWCIHCCKALCSRPRGLCFACYGTPGIRGLYAPRKNQFTDAVPLGDFNGGYTPPLLPTPAPPGTAEKIAVLTERAERRERLWHPRDNLGG
jgi:hypothetical protein